MTVIKSEDIFDSQDIKKGADTLIKFLDDAIKKGKELSDVFSNDLKKSMAEVTKKPNSENYFNLEKSKKQVDDTTKSVKELTKTQQELIKLDKQLETQEAKLTDEYQKANKAVIKNREELTKKTSEQRKAIRINALESTSLSRIEKELADNINKYKLLTKEQRKNKTEGKALIKTIQRQDKEVKKLNATLGRHQGNVGNYTTALKGSASALIGSFGVVGGVAALGAVLVSTTKKIIQFEKAQSDLLAVSGKTSDQLTELTDQALLLGQTTQFTATQVTQLQIELSKLGFSTEAIEQSTSAILDFAAATGADLPSAALVAGGALRAFGLSAIEMDRVVSTLAVATTKSALKFEDYQTAISTVFPIAKKFGLQIEDVTAILGKLRDVQFDASSASTALRNILLKLADPASELSKKFGGAATTSTELFRRLKVLKDEGVNLGEVLELTDVRASAAFSTMIDSVDGIDVLKESITGVNDELNAMVDKKLDNLAGDLTKLSSVWEGFVLQGKGGINVFRSLIQLVSDAVIELSNLDLIFTKTSNLTEEQVKRTYDALLSLNNNMAEIFRENIAYLDKIDIELLGRQKEGFIKANREAGLGMDESLLLWDEYYKRREKQAENEIEIQKELAEKQAEWDATQADNKAKQDAINSDKSVKDTEKARKAKEKALQAEIDLIYTMNKITKGNSYEINGLAESENEAADALGRMTSRMKEYIKVSKEAKGETEDYKTELQKAASEVDSFFNKYGSVSNDIVNSLDSMFATSQEKWAEIADGYNTQITEQENKAAEERSKMERGVANSYNSEIEKLGQLTEAQKRAADKEKEITESRIRVQEAMAVANMIAAVAGAFAANSETGPPGWIIAIAAGVALVAEFYALESEINQLEEGGLIEGARHSEGGINVIVGKDKKPTYNVEGGEFITNRKSTKKSRQLLDMVNEGIIDDSVLPELETYKKENEIGYINYNYSHLNANTAAIKDLTRSTKNNTFIENGYLTKVSKRRVTRTRLN